MDESRNNQAVSGSILQSIKNIINYYYIEAEADFEDGGKFHDDHVFNDIENVSKWLIEINSREGE